MKPGEFIKMVSALQQRLFALLPDGDPIQRHREIAEKVGIDPERLVFAEFLMLVEQINPVNFHLIDYPELFRLLDRTHLVLEQLRALALGEVFAPTVGVADDRVGISPDIRIEADAYERQRQTDAAGMNTKGRPFPETLAQDAKLSVEQPRSPNPANVPVPRDD